MASKVIGFRLAEDLAEELEKVSEGRGMTVAEFLRSLVDDALYPGTHLHDEESDDILREQQEMKTIKSNINDLENKVDTLSMKLKGAQDTVKLVNEYKASSGLFYSELQKEVSDMGLQLADMDNLSAKVKQLGAEVTHLSTDITVIKREIERQPTGDTHTLAFKGGTEHKYAVYKSPKGLVKPHLVARDPFGNKYVDLAEPLD